MNSIKKIFYSHKRIFIFLSALIIFVLLLFLSSFTLNLKSRPFSYAVYDKEGKLIGAQVATDEQWRLEECEVPEKFEKAIIAFEDKRFYSHPGVDPFSLARAFSLNLKNHRIVSGGSTITMQTIRLLENHPKRTIFQKAKEALLAVSLEMRFSKKEILSLYCANAPFGGNVVGLEAASWRYFNRAPDQLTWAETATLAVLPNQPALVYPGANKEILLAKRNELLQKLYKNGEFSEKILALSQEEELPQKPYALPALSPHYLEYLKKTATKDSPKNQSQTKFHTTLDSNIQLNSARILERWSEVFSKKGIENAAALVLETKTGNILAYCANTGGYERNPDNYAVDLIQAKRSSGSLLKPFLFAAMIDSGKLLKNQLVIDVPIRIGSYRPDNNLPEYQGVISAADALSSSLNIPAIGELREYGVSAFLAHLKRIGFTTFHRTADEYGLPLILGGGEVTLFEVTNAYAKMMNKSLDRPSDFPSSRGSVYLTLSALVEGARPRDEANWKKYAHSKKIAWKTGTSNGNRDAWCVGTTPEFTVGIWVGNAAGNGNTELKSSFTAAPIMFDIFSTLGQTSWQEVPYSELKLVEVCEKSGFLAGKNCEKRRTAFTAKNAPISTTCPYCRIVSLTPDGKFQATADDLPAGELPLIQKRFVLPPNIENWYKRVNMSYNPLPPFVENHKKSTNQDLVIIFPDEKANLIIPVEIDGTKGSMIMQAAARKDDSIVYWDLDGDFLGKTQNFHEMAASPKTGAHTLTICDSNGTSLTRHFTVLSAEN
ncbi:penicillin-binding protein 1C [Treponema zioleckii]|uniref:penicillin-binding protein 1C n=1 Tax=Treponema zioleckii TaxID=331680 RepID=UPI00168B0379|nr:penicillin-binding protein 1C [Treponema zioleckii]